MRAQLAPADRIALFRAPGASEHAFGGGASAVTRPSRPPWKALGWGHPYGNIVSKQQQNAVDTLSGSTVTSSATQDNGTYTSAYSYKGPRPHAPTEVDDTVAADVSSTTVNGSFTYDPSGNRSGWTRTSSNGTTTRSLTFDEENRLTQVTQNGRGLPRMKAHWRSGLRDS